MEKEKKYKLILNLTKKEVDLLRNSTSDLGTTDKVSLSLQLEIVNTILETPCMRSVSINKT